MCFVNNDKCGDGENFAMTSDKLDEITNFTNGNGVNRTEHLVL
jgi:hypothetical protein